MWTTLAAAAFVGFSGELWRQWKGRRSEIRMVRDKDGSFVDVVKIYERRFFKAVVWFLALCFFLSRAILMTI